MDQKQQQINKLISSISAAMSGSILRSGEHTSVVDNTGKALEILKKLCVDGACTISVGNNNLLVNGSPISKMTPEAKKFLLKLRKKGLLKIVLRKDAGQDELRKFFSELASSAALSNSYNAILLTYSKEAVEPSSSGQSIPGEILKIKELFRDLSIYKTIDTSAIDAVIGSFIVAVRKDMDILRLLVPARAGRDLAFIHNANVAMLSIFQAEILGFDSDTLYDIGFSALVHDIGKVLLPGFLGKQTTDPEEMLIVKKHPAYGASLLASLSKIPELAVIVAFEHHMKYDGTGYPETKHGKRQHIVSQMVAISDFFDTMRTELPSRKPLHVNAIAGIMRATSGTEFNPLLVENLLRALKP